MHTRVVTAVAFTLANLVLLRARVRVEDAALRSGALHAGPTHVLRDRAA